MRRHLSLVVLLSVTVALLALMGGFYLVLSVRLERAADSVLEGRADAVVATLASSGGRLAVLDTPGDGTLDDGVWVFDGAGLPIVAAAASVAVQQAVAGLASTGHESIIDVGQDTRLLARPFSLDAQVRGTVVVAVSRLPFEQTEREALVAMIAFGAAVLLAAFLGSLLLVKVALQPVVRMTAQAADWSAHDPEHRFGLGPPRDEFTQLGATLDGLMARVSAALHHEQRLTAEIAHELRTPLARARTQGELALRRPRSPAALREALAMVLRDIDATSGALDALLEASRAMHASGPGLCDSRQAARGAVAEARMLSGAESLTWRLQIAADLPLVSCDESHLARTLAPLLQNAVTYARSEVGVEVMQVDEELLFRVTDDGPGVMLEEADRLAEAGARGSAAEGLPGYGLGLALATRLARAAGGRLSVMPGPGGTVELRMPCLPSAVMTVSRTDPRG